MLLVLSAPRQLLVLAGPEHGRTIPLADIDREFGQPGCAQAAAAIWAMLAAPGFPSDIDSTVPENTMAEVAR